MAKARGVPPNPPSIKTRGVLLKVRNEKFGDYVKAWPRKMGTSKDPNVLATNQMLKTVAATVKNMTPDDYNFARDMTRATAWTWKDYLTALAFGTTMEIHLVTGQTRWSYRLMTTQIQAMLDTISTQIGSMVIRTPEGWSAIVPGTAGQVLTSRGPGQVPDYETPAGGGGAGGAPVGDPGPLNTTTTNISATGSALLKCIAVSKGATLAGLVAYQNGAAADCALVPVVYSDVNGKPGALLATGAATVNLSSGANRVAFTSKLTFPDATTVFIGFIVHSGTWRRPESYGGWEYVFSNSDGIPPDPAPNTTTSATNFSAWWGYND